MCVYAFVAFPVLGGRDACVCVCVRGFLVVGIEEAYVCMRSRLSPW